MGKPEFISGELLGDGKAEARTPITMPRPILALLTDFRTQDHYVGVL